jgi:hypothetical protein
MLRMSDCGPGVPAPDREGPGGQSLPPARSKRRVLRYGGRGRNQGTNSETVLLRRCKQVESEEGSGRLLFDKNTNKLFSIVLDFSVHTKNEGPCFSGLQPEDEVLRVHRVSVIGDKLVDRYGKPATEKGLWPSSAGLIDYFVRRRLNNLEAVRIWKDSGQAIEARVDLQPARGSIGVMLTIPLFE